HAHYALPAGGAALSWARRHDVPLVVSVHGGDVLGPAVADPAARQRIGSVLRSADAVMCNSHPTLERSALLAGSDANMRVVHLGADPPKHPKPRREVPTVATLGHLVARKRHADVLRAVRLARERVPELEWLVIGDGPEREALEELARRIGVAEHVTFAGQLEPEEALAELASCHLMALPSVDEAFGVAYVEALACGVPAIGALGEGGPEEIAALSRSMLLVPPGDAEALASLIADLLESRAEVSALAAQARRGAARHFSWEACGKATVECYREALE
ncbi:MAG: glycosyltransferase, partial [Thermoleophilaceae bacterium]|nr:glycosyltransferase [Thermoleophilaceae bacterium]